MVKHKEKVDCESLVEEMLTVIALAVLLVSFEGKESTTDFRKAEKLEILVKTWISGVDWRDAVLLLELVLLLLVGIDRTAAWIHDRPCLHIRGPP